MVSTLCWKYTKKFEFSHFDRHTPKSSGFDYVPKVSTAASENTVHEAPQTEVSPASTEYHVVDLLGAKTASRSKNNSAERMERVLAEMPQTLEEVYK